MSFCEKYHAIFSSKWVILWIFAKFSSQIFRGIYNRYIPERGTFWCILVRSGTVRIILDDNKVRNFLCSRTFSNVHVCPNQNPDGL